MLTFLENQKGLFHHLMTHRMPVKVAIWFDGDDAGTGQHKESTQHVDTPSVAPSLAS